MLELRGLMAVAPLGEDPAAAFARLAEIRARVPRPPPGGDLALGGDERGPRARDPGRRDTRARRLRGPRFEAPEPVVSQTGGAASRRGRRTRKAATMSGAMRRIGEYLGLLEDTGRYDDEYADGYDDDLRGHYADETARWRPSGRAAASRARPARPRPSPTSTTAAAAVRRP